MSIMDLFKPAAPNTAGTAPNAGATSPNGSNNNTNSQDASSMSGVQGMGGQPGEGQMPGTNQTPANPLDAYKKMFDNAANTGQQAPEFKIDPEVLGKVSSTMDFTKGVQQEVVQKALTGDVNSLMEVIKTVGQNAYRASIEHNSALTGAYLDQRSTFDQGRVVGNVRQQLTQAELAQTPNYEHPVIKNELNRIASQYARANPDASPQAIAKAAQTYINELYSAMNPASSNGGDSNAGGGGEMDWSKYLT